MTERERKELKITQKKNTENSELNSGLIIVVNEKAHSMELYRGRITSYSFTLHPCTLSHSTLNIQPTVSVPFGRLSVKFLIFYRNIANRKL